MLLYNIVLIKKEKNLVSVIEILDFIFVETNNIINNRRNESIENRNNVFQMLQSRSPERSIDGCSR